VEEDEAGGETARRARFERDEELRAKPALCDTGWWEAIPDRKRNLPMTTKLTIRRPDDWHVHLRDGAVLEGVIAHTSAHFARAIVMPNLVPPVVTVADAQAYRARIMAAVPENHFFTPLMTLYLTEQTDPDDVAAGFRDGEVTAVQLYTAGAHTN
jgi:dihydroorotase